MTSRIPIPPELSEHGFRVSAADTLGITPRRLQGSDLARPFHGVRSGQPPSTPIDHARAFQPILRARQGFGEHTAASILGIPHRESLHERGLVVVGGTTDAHTRRPRVLARRIAPERLALQDVHGLTVTSPELTWLMLGRTHSISELVVAGDALVATANHYPGRGPSALTSLEELGVEVAMAGQIPGIARLRRAYPLLRAGSESPRESLLRYLIIERGLPEPELQYEHHHPRTGRLIGRSDLYWPFARVAGEYEGRGHREKRRWDKDIDKYQALERLGIVTIRATDANLFPSPAAWLDDLASLLAARS